jgi:hypothetical protein
MATAATKICAQPLDLALHRVPPLCTDRHKIKPRMRECKYIHTAGSRGPRIKSRPQKDPDDHLGTPPSDGRRAEIQR